MCPDVPQSCAELGGAIGCGEGSQMLEPPLACIFQASLQAGLHTVDGAVLATKEDMVAVA